MKMADQVRSRNQRERANLSHGVTPTDKKFLLSRSPLAIRNFSKRSAFFFEKRNKKLLSVSWRQSLALAATSASA
jgi:hypothetical protein